jgi:hypothetical protein
LLATGNVTGVDGMGAGGPTPRFGLHDFGFAVFKLGAFGAGLLSFIRFTGLSTRVGINNSLRP